MCPKFIGKFDQIPPQYSAKKLNGKKAYQLARSGEEIQLKPRAIEIYDLSCKAQLKKNTFLFEITCSSGTYIRSLCRDFAEALSTYGTMLAIVRTKSGDYDITQSCTISDIEKGNYKILTV